MWICTPFGILMPAVRPAKHTPAGDNRTMQVRARHKEYLDIFRADFCPELGESIHFPNMDYQWKAYVTPEALAAAMAKLMLAIDFEKFKPESYKTEKWGGLPQPKATQLHGLYNTMWADMLSAGDKSSIYDKGWGGSSQRHDARKCYTLGHWYPKSTPDAQPCVDCGHPSTCTGCVACSLRKQGSKNNFPQPGSLEYIIDLQYAEQQRNRLASQPKEGTAHKSFAAWLYDNQPKPQPLLPQVPAAGTYSTNSALPGVLAGLVPGHDGTGWSSKTSTTDTPVPGNWNNYTASDDPSCEVVYEDNDVTIYSTEDGYWTQRNGEQGSTGPFESRQAAAEYVDVPLHLV
jgi:hypothetical protein